MGRGGKVGIPAVIAIVVALLFGPGVMDGGGGGGFDPDGALDRIDGNRSVSASTVPPGPAGSTRDEHYERVVFVRNNVQDFWARDFAQAGRRYDEAGLVIFDAPTPTACGTGPPRPGRSTARPTRRCTSISASTPSSRPARPPW